MAQDPQRPRDSGKVGMPRIDPGMNRVPKIKPSGGKGAKDDKPTIMLGTDPKEGEDDKILARARKRLDFCISTESENRVQGLESLKFRAGDQWPSAIAAQRNSDGRPCYTVNKIPTFVNQVVNTQRENRPGITVSAVGDRSDVEVAKMLRGAIRYFERASHAEVAYDTAFDAAASIGWGYWRTLTEFLPGSFNQTIKVARIRNTFSVYMDPMCQEQDGSDANYAFVCELIPRNEFEERYPDAAVASLTEAGAGDTYKNWIDDKNVRVAEYFEIDHDKRRLVALDNGHVGYWDDLSAEVKADIEAGRVEIRRDREEEVPQVKWYKMTGTEILERRDWVGNCIPIVRVVGNELDIEGKVRLSGVIQNAKEPQRLNNYVHTMMIETIALQPKAPWVGAEGQFDGHASKWDAANRKSFAYLEYKPTALQGMLVPPPQRNVPSLPVQGWAQLNELAAQDMMATTGIRFDATLQERTVDESGRAIQELRRSSDTGSFHYYDNLCRSLKHQGDIFIDLIVKVIDVKQMLTILREDGSEEQIQVDPRANKPFQEGKHPVTGKVLKIYNPTIGKYGVTVTIGPSYATKRIEAAESMMQFVKFLPNTAQYIADLIAKNQDWPEAELISTRLAKLLPAQLLAPEMKDVPPQVQALLQGMDGQIKGLTQQLAQAMTALQEKNTDRAIERDKIEKDFEAKILNVVARFEAAASSTQEKAAANLNTHLAAQMKELGNVVGSLAKSMDGSGRKNGGGGADQEGLPEQVLGMLTEDAVTTFNNGQKWTKHLGRAVRVS